MFSFFGAAELKQCYLLLSLLEKGMSQLGFFFSPSLDWATPYTSLVTVVETASQNVTCLFEVPSNLLHLANLCLFSLIFFLYSLS